MDSSERSAARSSVQLSFFGCMRKRFWRFNRRNHETRRLLQLIATAVDSEMGWQDVTELQTFLRDGVVG